MRPMRLAALTTAATLVLGACASIPVEGPVQEGDGIVDPIEPFQPIAQGPGATDDPEAIVTGFLTASASGVASDFTLAREFLTDEAASTWDPAARTLVYDSGAVAPQWDEPGDTVTYEVPVAAEVDESGRLTDTADETVERIEFEMARNDEGEWRIAALADGVVLPEANFVSFFRAVQLVFATPDLTTAVPEQRWLPRVNAATAAARELVEGPSSWLADAVVTGFPAAAALAVESVVVTGGVATVDLTAQSAGSPEERALADEQLRLTLGSLPDVTDVEVRIGGLPIADEESVTLDKAPVPDAVAAVIADDRLGLWDGDGVAVPAQSGGVGVGAGGVALSYDGTRVAFSVEGVGVQVTEDLASGLDSLVPLETGQEGAGAGEGEEIAPAVATTVIAGDDMVAPSFDRFGNVWSVASGGGALQVAGVGGEAFALGDEWLGSRTVVAIALSRDGSRIAVLSRAGGQAALEVAAIVREADGSPTGIGEPLPVGGAVGAGVDIAWTDALTVAVLGEPIEGSSTPLWVTSVGGRTTTLGAMTNAVAITARSGESSLVVVGAEGAVEERAGTSWTPVAEGIEDLSYAG
ncbi:LpqB family beta-propeller domain-containing protein [Demequina sp. NBRC 110051]|uniref:LpqB family beta-propeller domain-containing protein n=1 Tax=Demequina sp. NBRC 110051 TaxID=1570340 RepID=UPI000A055A9F|nr:LpqB family beta-propeller domain-containing protein [Demequina sp. NBRC 110051]